MAKKIIFFLYFLLIAFSSAKAKMLIIEPKAITIRTFNNAKIDSLKKIPDFDYREDIVAETASLWQRFWNFVWYFFRKLLFDESTSTGRQSVLIILGIACIGFVIYKVLQMDNASFLSGTATNNPDFYYNKIENINELNFDEEIKKAISNANYRLALRLLYLKSLKELSGKNYIVWDASKTNSQYLRELKDQNMREQFGRLTLQFEFAWYGNFDLNQTDFSDAQQEFSSFQEQIK
ncbi:hypothetical protein A5893_01585 [Pedobacter psychrophilus]|uniref:Protein-glutamine gamma-glutamyltransferase-like C-terminal domain-containing protein n=1 Tax=Pedobacter psychrophilus TaxID=1826909 RepID=A0A179DLA5_9SPHI|nr:DUF4129 domain-containing protein [Pedobacter psychrophilus]OAQ41835.1 hypothetical protein A5893_01585 [Pedobacter psychrophilus]